MNRLCLIAIFLAVAVIAIATTITSARRLHDNNNNNVHGRHRSHGEYKAQKRAELRQRHAPIRNNAAVPDKVCAGSFQMCPSTGECTLIGSLCGKGSSSCTAGSYMCPPLPGNKIECRPKFSECPNLAGTFWDTSLSVKKRVELLAAATNLSQQAGQLTNFAPAMPDIYVPAFEYLDDDLHGLRGAWTSSFPDSIGLAATWSTDSLRTVGTTIGEEARAVMHFYTSRGIRGVSPIHNGITVLSLYAPMSNVAVHARWGRNQESYGEDTHLVTQLALSYIDGAQTWKPMPGKEEEQKQQQQQKNVRSSTSRVMAVSCIKHYAVYDVESFSSTNPFKNKDRYHYTAVVKHPRNLWETYLPQFRASATSSNPAGAVMCSYNALETPGAVVSGSIPTCASTGLLTGLLRDKWNWGGDLDWGFVVSDYDAAANLVLTHKYAANFTQAAAIAWAAGMDQEGGGDVVASQLPEAVQTQGLDASVVTRSFKRVFTQRFEAGLLDAPEQTPDRWAYADPTTVGDSEHLQRVLDVTHESITMYKNSNATLPLQDTKSNICLIGPLAAATGAEEGNYATRVRQGSTSLLQGLCDAALPKTATTTVQGANVLKNTAIALLMADPQFPANSSIASASDCLAACLTSLSCNYWQFTQGGVGCYLLPRQGKFVTDSKSTSGARPGQSLKHYNTSFFAPSSASSLISVKADSFRECSQRCRVNRECAVFSFNVIDSACYMLPSKYSSSATNADDVWESGFQPDIPCTNVHYASACADHTAECKLPLGFDEAVQLVSDPTKCKTAVVLTGLDQHIESEGHDRHTIDLPANSKTLLELLAKASRESGVKLVGVFQHGGVFKFDPSGFDAILDSWYPGELGGRAVADTLFGFNSPAGRSTLTWYSDDSDLPPALGVQDLYADAGFKGLTYRYYKATSAASAPLLPFGTGASYVDFSYTDIQVSASKVSACDDITVSLTVSPVGKAPLNSAGHPVVSDHVVMVFARQPQATVPVPNVRLVAFQRLKKVDKPTRATLVVRPRTHAAVYENITHPFDSVEMVETGMLDLFVSSGAVPSATAFPQGKPAVTVMVDSLSPVDKCDKK